MKDTIATTLILLLLLMCHAVDSQPDVGTIPFDCPDTPHAKFQFHFTRELIALADTTAPFNTVSDLYIRTYDAEAGLFDKFVRHYGETLKAANWQNLQKDNGVLLYILEAPSAQSSQSNKTVLGIFAVVKSDSNVYLLNILGDIPAQQTGQLLANLGQIGIEISALKSLDVQTFQRFEEPPELMPPPTLLRTIGKQPDFFRVGLKKESSKFGLTFSRSHNKTLHGHWSYYGHPIEQIHIRSDSKDNIAQISEALQKGPADIEKIIDSLPSVNTSEHKKKLVVHTWERLATISIGNIPDRKNDPSMLAKQFRTQEGEPIHEIQIRGHRDTDLDDVRKALEKGSEEIEKAIETLPGAISDLEETRLRIEEKGDRRTAIVTMVEKPLPSRFYVDSSPQIGFNRALVGS